MIVSAPLPGRTPHVGRIDQAHELLGRRRLFTATAVARKIQEDAIVGLHLLGISEKPVAEAIFNGLAGGGFSQQQPHVIGPKTVAFGQRVVHRPGIVLRGSQRLNFHGRGTRQVAIVDPYDHRPGRPIVGQDRRGFVFPRSSPRGGRR